MDTISIPLLKALTIGWQRVEKLYFFLFFQMMFYLRFRFVFTPSIKQSEELKCELVLDRRCNCHMENVGYMSRLLAMLFACWPLARFIGYFVLDTTVRSNSHECNQIGLQVAERVVYVTSGQFSAEVNDSVPSSSGDDIRFITAAYSLSLGTNALATVMIAYKTWCATF
jgi:hypothetical protein